ncbi:hypothetical protein GINT2_001906 [Glugoides intestinalis]
MENEQELEKIFEEKLYVSKRQPFLDLSNFKYGGKRGSIQEKRSFGDKEMKGHGQMAIYPFLKEEDKLSIKYEKKGSEKRLGEDVYKQPNLPKECSLEGIYDDIELQDVLKTKELLTIEKEAGKGGFSIKEGLENQGNESNGVYKGKLQELEREFQNMIKTQNDALELKSKVYKFIYREIYGLRKEFSEKIASLEKENLLLKEEVQVQRGRVEESKQIMVKYNEKVVEKALEWKKTVERSVKEYLKRAIAKKP